MDNPGRLEHAEARAKEAKAHEIDAHRRAVELHEKAAALFDGLRHTEEARNAFRRADNAREMLRQALAEEEILQQACTVSMSPDEAGAGNVAMSYHELRETAPTNDIAQRPSMDQFDAEVDRIEALLKEVRRQHTQINEDFSRRIDALFEMDRSLLEAVRCLEDTRRTTAELTDAVQRLKMLRAGDHLQLQARQGSGGTTSDSDF